MSSTPQFKTEVFSFTVIVVTSIVPIVTKGDVSEGTIRMALLMIGSLAVLSLVYALIKSPKEQARVVKDGYASVQARSALRGAQFENNTVEINFLRWEHEQLLPFRRLAMLLGGALYIGYFLLDVLAVGAENEILPILLVNRLVITAGILAAWLFSYLELFRRVESLLYELMHLVAALGITTQIYIAGDKLLFYYVGLVTVLMFLAFLLQASTKVVARFSILIFIAYTATIMVLVGEERLKPGVHLSYNYFFLLTSMLIAWLGSRSLQTARRKMWAAVQPKGLR